LHETYLDMAACDGPSFPDRARFMGYAARVMRGVIIDHARKHRALKYGGEFKITSLQPDLMGKPVDAKELLVINDVMTSLGYDETQKAVKLFNDWALTLSYAGRQLEAEKTYRRAIDISRANQTEDAVSPVLLYNYAGVLRELGRFSEAADYAERAFAKAQRAGDEILLAQVDLQRARVYRDQKDFVRANSLLADLEPRMRHLLPPKHYAFASLASDRGLLALAQGDATSALQFADQALAIDEASVARGGPCAAYLPILLLRRSSAELALGQRDQAAADAGKALGLLRSSTAAGASSSDLGYAYMAHGRALLASSRPEEARASFRSAVEQLDATLGSGHRDTQIARRLAEPESARP
jgi:tetratricopeptide (TPR) repeat protein